MLTFFSFVLCFLLAVLFFAGHRIERHRERPRTNGAGTDTAGVEWPGRGWCRKYRWKWKKKKIFRPRTAAAAAAAAGAAAGAAAALPTHVDALAKRYPRTAPGAAFFGKGTGARERSRRDEKVVHWFVQIGQNGEKGRIVERTHAVWEEGCA